MIRIDIPATSANLGSGFDSLGIALTMCNRVWMEEADELKITTTDKIKVPTDETNLIYWAARHLYQICGKTLPGLHIIQENNIPMARGLGSSSACIVAGILGANRMLGSPMSQSDLINLAAQIEGHPDNTSPAISGGLVASAMEGKRVYSVSVPVSGKISFAVMIPPFELKTEKARGVLPTEYSREDTVFNLSRSALMTASLFSGDLQNLRVAVQDRIHQPYRSGLIENYDQVFRMSYELGSLGTYVSGAGPTIISMIPTEGAEEFMSACDSHLQDRGINGWRVELLHTDPQGARIIIEYRELSHRGYVKGSVSMALIVQKFGGSSVKDAEHLRNVADIVTGTYKNGNDVVVVVSAQGDTTDDLIDKAKEINRNPSKREMDQLLTAGEQISASLLAMTIEDLGYPVVSLLGWQAGFSTSTAYGSARIKRVNPERIKAELSKRNIVVVTGFQGVNKYDDMTTLGRGGSDTSAVAIAASMHADLCQIYTDVDGVYTADPRKIPAARKLDVISYDEMLELATLGAQVLNNRSVEMAKKYHIELEVLSSLTRAKGTIVKEATNVEKMLISGVAKDENVARISVIGVPDKPGLAFRIFSKLAQKNVNVDIILQSIGRNGTKDISFTVEKDKMDATIELMQSYVETIGASSVVFDDDVAKVSIVGAGMESHPGVASDMFEALFEANVNIQMISTSEIKISVLIKKEDANKAVAAIHAKFFEQIGQ